MVVSSVLVSGIVINVGSALFLCAAFTRFPFGSLRRSPPLEAEGYSSLAYRLVGYADPVRAGRVSHRNRYRSTCLRSTPAIIGVAHLGKRGRPGSAALLRLWHLYRRTVDPVAFAEGRWPRWPLLAYFMLTEIGLAILGYALLSSDLPTWIGWMLIGSMVLLLVLTLIYRDMPPLMFYLVTLIAGIALLA